jgi:membrane protein YdbS with pleckstrin-like domain
MTDYRTLDPRSMRSMRIGYLLATAVFAVAAVVLFFLRDLHEALIYACIGAAALAVLMAVLAIVFPKIYYDHYRYFISEDRVDVRRGIIFLTHTVVPLERIHQVEVVSGPINRMYGLADVSITTAGGVAKIEYLETEEAERIADELNAIVDAIVKGQRNE